MVNKTEESGCDSRINLRSSEFGAIFSATEFLLLQITRTGEMPTILDSLR